MIIPKTITITVEMTIIIMIIFIDKNNNNSNNSNNQNYQLNRDEHNNNSNNNINKNNNENNDDGSPVVLKYWVSIQQGITMSHGQIEVFNLDSLPRDGVSIKTMTVVTLHHHKPLMNKYVIK